MGPRFPGFEACSGPHCIDMLTPARNITHLRGRCKWGEVRIALGVDGLHDERTELLFR